ncbi:uncharacterized protein BX664DRAFT_320915 [Halteromyces radiatus]|uniref:uncharacterized protein n=1 Tax=Halteromyces radiatus TaxID=101107 RepID=UPI0022209580|nr:uncharacterized protein BX664DRAFT_320915 [Halteromyces radiatus]KAI8099281.1 hypothetical protein BX664DRAFT_320915 [Halteromyces radiatus]
MPRLPTEEEDNITGCCGLSRFFSNNNNNKTLISISADEEKKSFSPYTYSAIPSMDNLPAYEDCISRAFEQLDMKQDNILENIVQDALTKVDKDLRTISLDLHEHMEVGMKEKHAHDLLTGYMEKQGFKITRHAYGMETAFMAEYSRGQGGRRVGICSEYDGLPGLGQGCGHNLIAISGLAAAIGIKAAMENNKVEGKVILFGTPAEELSIGKIQLVNKRAFQDNVDVCLMLHPSAVGAPYAQMIAVQDVKVEFFGKPTHAAASPWEGVNALDAMVQLWNNISMMRQQLMPTDRVHGIVTDGGQAPNVIPAHTSAFFFVRTPKYTELKRVMDKMEGCFEAAAIATGCKVKWTWRETPTKDVVQNNIMAATYGKYMEKAGVQFPPRQAQEQGGGGSTDMGNVSYVVPSIHPMFAIHTTASNHTVEFTKAAKTIQAHQDTMLASKSLALTALHVYTSESYYKAVKKDFNDHVPLDEQH